MLLLSIYVLYSNVAYIYPVSCLVEIKLFQLFQNCCFCVFHHWHVNFLSRYLINSLMIKIIHKLRSYQNHNLQFNTIWPIRINALRHYFCPLNYNLYISHTITSLFVTARESVPLAFHSTRWRPKSHLPLSLRRDRHTPSRELPPKPVDIPRPKGKPSHAQ